MKTALALMLLLSSLLLFGCAQYSAPTTTYTPTVTATPTPTLLATTQTATPTPLSAQTTPIAEPTATPTPTITKATVQEFALTAKQWEFIPSTLTVKKGIPVKITITVPSNDVTHGFGILEFNVNKELKPGETTIVEFTPDKAGEFTFFCTVPCGSGHAGMRGKLIVTE